MTRQPLPTCHCGFHYLRPTDQPNWDGDRTRCPVLEYEAAHGVDLRTVGAAMAEAARIMAGADR